MQPEKIIQLVAAWAKTSPQILALALVGSHARGGARPDSDIDFVVITNNPAAFRACASWLDLIHWDQIGAAPANWQDEDHGAVWSRRLWLTRNAGEIEFSFAPPSWTSLDPVDPGTNRVIRDGCRILHDPLGKLTSLCDRVTPRPP